MFNTTSTKIDNLESIDSETSVIEAVIMDWAGTTVDFGSRAPMKGFQKLFENYQISVTEDEVRIPMGAEKREHIRQLLTMPRIRNAWIKLYHSRVTDADIDEMYQAFIALQKIAIGEHNKLIPGMLDTLNWLEKRSIKVGANTGYANEMIDELLIAAKRQGYQPQSNVCATEVANARPYPDMCLTNAMQLGVRTLGRCVKIDDTAPGIEEGVNAGMWTIGLSVSGNEVGMSVEQWESLDEKLQDSYRLKAFQKLQKAGSNYVVDSIAQVVPCLIDIENRISLGERP